MLKKVNEFLDKFDITTKFELTSGQKSQSDQENFEWYRTKESGSIFRGTG